MGSLRNVPKAISRQTGETKEIDKIMNDFFINTKQYIQSRLMERHDSFFEIKSAELVCGIPETEEYVISNNRITYLEYKEKWVVAGMLQTRTGFNNLEFTFFRDLECLRTDRGGGIIRGVY